MITPVLIFVRCPTAFFFLPVPYPDAYTFYSIYLSIVCDFGVPTSKFWIIHYF